MGTVVSKFDKFLMKVEKEKCKAFREHLEQMGADRIKADYRASNIGAFNLYIDYKFVIFLERGIKC